eukprot:1844386-Pleurochrysis_carterae.AAC.1
MPRGSRARLPRLACSYSTSRSVRSFGCAAGASSARRLSWRCARRSARRWTTCSARRCRASASLA